MSALQLWLLITVAIVSTAAVGVWLALRTRAPRGAARAPEEGRADASSATALAAVRPSATAGPAPGTAYDDPRLAQLRFDAWCAAFGCQLTPDEARVGGGLGRDLRQAMRGAVNDRRYFPRRPMVIPQLLRAMRSDETGTRELVEIILQDALLTADALRLANSAAYRTSADPIDSIGRAVTLLGHDGLRSLISAAVLQPVFRVPGGRFERFSACLWSNAQYGALAAQRYARQTGRCDSFVAHLAVLLAALGTTVLFRATMDRIGVSEAERLEPAMLIGVLSRYGDVVALRIVESWELAAPIPRAIGEQLRRPNLDQMSPLGLALYYGRIGGDARLLADEGEYDAAPVRALLADKGLTERQIGVLLGVAR